MRSKREPLDPRPLGRAPSLEYPLAQRTLASAALAFRLAARLARLEAHAPVPRVQAAGCLALGALAELGADASCCVSLGNVDWEPPVAEHIPSGPIEAH